MRWAAGIIAVVLIAAGAGVWALRANRDVVLAGVLETDVIDVGSLVGGRVADVLVEPGQTVAAGDVLVRLEPFDTQERLTEAQAELAARQATLQTLQEGPRPEALAHAQARRAERQASLSALLAGPNDLNRQVAQDEVAVAQSALVEAEGEFDAFKTNGLQSSGSLSAMDRIVRRVAAARANLDAKRAQLEAMEAGSPVEAIEAARARLAEADADLALLKAGPTEATLVEAAARIRHAESRMATVRRHAGEYEVKAPVAGVVATVDAREGAVVPANATSVTLYAGDAWRFVAPRPEGERPFAEKSRVRVRRTDVGEHAKDRPAMVQRLRERVRWIDVDGEGAKPTQVLEVTLAFEGGQPPAAAGSLVEVRPAPPEQTKKQ